MSGAEDRSAIEALTARAEIRSRLADYFDAVQRHDWPGVSAHFTPDALVDYGTPGVRGVDDNVELLRLGTERLTSRSTLLGMHSLINIDGLVATSETVALTAHAPPTEGGDAPPTEGDPPPAGAHPLPAEGAKARLSAVRYEDEWRRGDDAVWRVTRRTCHHESKWWCQLR
jgi:hypothetical protein